MTRLSEAYILEQLATKEGQQRGFAALIELYSESLYWHIRRLVVVHEDSEDVLQECFINVHKYFGGFKGDSSLKTWLYRVATNEAIRFLTKKRLETASYDENNKLIALFEGDDSINFDSAEAQLQKALLALPQKQRLVFNLRYFDQMSYEQIAQITSSSVATLKTNYHYAQSRIKEYLLTHFEEVDYERV